jgi:FSR family fosmidomycin resistance protein-like MFS transporter
MRRAGRVRHEVEPWKPSPLPGRCLLQKKPDRSTIAGMHINRQAIVPEGKPAVGPRDNVFHTSKVLTLSGAHLLHDTFSAFLAPLLPLLTTKLGMSLSVTSFLDIMRRLPTLFNPVFGVMAERRGIKRLVILTPAVTAISMSLVGPAPTIPILFVLIFVAGISAALFHVPSPVLIREASGNRVGMGMSFYMVGGELARTLGPLLVISAVSLWSLEGIFRLAPIGIGASVVLHFKLKDLDVQRKVSKMSKSGDISKILRSYRPLFITLSGFILFQSLMKSALTLYLPLYLTNRGASLWLAGASLAILQFFGVIGTFMSGILSDRLSRGTTLLISSIGTIAAMALFLLFHHVVFLALIGFFIFSTGPVLLALVQDTDSTMPTFMNGIYMAIGFGVGSAAVFSLGVMGDLIGLEKTYVVSFFVAIGTIPTAILLPRFVSKS